MSKATKLLFQANQRRLPRETGLPENAKHSHVKGPPLKSLNLKTPIGSNTTTNNLFSLVNSRTSKESLTMQNIFTSFCKCEPASSLLVKTPYHSLGPHSNHPAAIPSYTTSLKECETLLMAKSLQANRLLNSSLTLPRPHSTHGWLWSRLMKPLQLPTQSQCRNTGQRARLDAKASL